MWKLFMKLINNARECCEFCSQPASQPGQQPNIIIPIWTGGTSAVVVPAPVLLPGTKANCARVCPSIAFLII